MTFNEGMQFDPDRASTGGGGRGRGIALGGGAGGLIVVVIALLMGVDPSSILGGSTGGDSGTAPDVSKCTTSEAANTDPNCRVIATAYSLDDVWGEELPKQTGKQYVTPAVSYTHLTLPTNREV